MAFRDDPAPRTWPGWLAWALAWAAMWALDGPAGLANQALVLVLAVALVALWWPAWACLVAGSVAVLAFNFAFVPPRGTFTVDLHQHAVLLLTMLAVGWIVVLLVTQLRRTAAAERRHAAEAEQLRALGDALREADDPRQRAGLLQQALSSLSGTAASLWLPPAEPGPGVPADDAAGLALACREGRALGPGTGRHEDRTAWYLPLRGRTGSYGAALLPLPADGADGGPPAQAQALCDQLGAALERAAALQAAQAAQAAAQAQALRSALLAAISHDHRTPLATILGAASSLHDQADRLQPEQRRRLAATIVDEATQLTRMTDNLLQLARLGAPGAALQRDWEAAEELVGTVLRRARQRGQADALQARVEPALPLLRCDAVLMVQLLDNLVDNALVHGGGAAEIAACRHAGGVLLAVRDRGPGVPPAERERIFEPFERGAPAAGRRGAGVGLALCRAIAQAHGAVLVLRPRTRGGSSFELVLPVEPAPGGLP